MLVLKLGALGNVVLSFGAFAAIRRHHADARISLLTTAPYAGWLAAAPWFDSVLIDARPAWWDLPNVLHLRRMLIAGRFNRVYDLQTSGRSSHYFRLFPRAARPEWSGIAPGCSHPDRNPDRDRLHDIDRLRCQLRQAGIPDMPPPDLSWCRGDIARFALPRPFALLVPGSSAHRPMKRWPAGHYRAVAAWLAARGIVPVVLGTAGERMLAEMICAGIPTQGTGAPSQGIGTPSQGIGAHSQGIGTSSQGIGMPCQGFGTPSRGSDMPSDGIGARDLTGQTGFGDLADLGRNAVFAVGNDTGPMHLLAAAGCPSLVLFSRDSDPARCVPCAPPGAPPVRVLRRDDLATLAPQEVIDTVQAAMPLPAEAPA